MLKLPPGPYDHLDQSAKVKLQAWVDPTDKAELMTIIPDRNLYSLIIGHALLRTITFARTHNLSFDNAADQSRLLNYILTGTDPVVAAPATDAAVPPAAQDGLRKRAVARPARKADARNDA